MDRPAKDDAAVRDRTGPASLCLSTRERLRSEAAAPNVATAVAGWAAGRGGMCVHYIVASKPREVRYALTRITPALAGFGLSPEDRVRAEVVLAEVMNNIVEHAYACSREGHLFVRIAAVAHALLVSVEDDGAPMPDQMLPQGQPQNLAVALHDLPEGGFGWFMIRALTEELGYERRQGRNRLTFSLPISARP